MLVDGMFLKMPYKCCISKTPSRHMLNILRGPSAKKSDEAGST